MRRASIPLLTLLFLIPWIGGCGDDSSPAAPEVAPDPSYDLYTYVTVSRVDVIKDNMVVFSRSPSPSSQEVSFEFRDAQPDPGMHYYYARVIQKDRNMAWVSPIWVEVTGKK